MLNINGSKQIGTLYHYTKRASNFWSICESLSLRPGTKQEPKEGKLQPFVAFSRESTAPKRSTHWKYGFIIDGDRLSEHYKLTPISFAYRELSQKSNSSIRIKSLRLYDDGSAAVYLIRYGSIPISKTLYDELALWIEDLSKAQKDKSRLIKKGRGKIRRNGRLLLASYTFDSPVGSPDISTALSDAAKSELSRSFRLYEAEERVWFDKATDLLVDTNQISIKGLLQGVILPKSIPDIDLAAICAGLEALEEHGFAIEPDDSDIGYRGAQSKIIRY